MSADLRTIIDWCKKYPSYTYSYATEHSLRKLISASLNAVYNISDEPVIQKKMRSNKIPLRLDDGIGVGVAEEIEEAYYRTYVYFLKRCSVSLDTELIDSVETLLMARCNNTSLGYLV